MKSQLEQKEMIGCLTIEFGHTLDKAQVEKMAELVDDAIEAADELRLLLDLSATETIEPSAFVSAKGTAVSFKSIGPVRRYAVIGAPRIAEVAVESFGKLLPLESKAFEPNEADAARSWAFDSVV